MSNQVSKKVSCPHCGDEVETQMWTSISAEVTPHIREQVLGETLFDWECPACGYRAQLVYPCLYHDKTRRFMVYVVPNGHSGSLQKTDVLEAFPNLRGVRKRVVSTPAALKEKLLIFEEQLDDRAVELVKLALAALVAKKSGKPVTAGYFCFADPDQNRIAFSFFLEEEPEPVRQSTRLDVYERSLEIVREVCAGPDEEFCSVDAAEAQRILDSYKE